MSDEVVLTEREQEVLKMMSDKIAQTATDTLNNVWVQIKKDFDEAILKAHDDTLEEVQKRIDSFLEQVAQNQSLTMTLSAVLEGVAKYLKTNKIVQADFDEAIATELKEFEARLIKQMEEAQKGKRA